MALAALVAAAPLAAFADPGDGHGHDRGRGEGHGEGHGERGGPPYGGGRWREEGNPGRSDPPPYGGRWGGRPAPPPDAGPYYGEPPRGRNSNSLGDYYGEQQDQAREGVRHGNVPMGQVMQNIRRRMPGRPLDAGLESSPDGRSVYRVRWAAADGRRIDYIIDARTGEILEAEGQ
jgi:hypothetical protein